MLNKKETRGLGDFMLYIVSGLPRSGTSMVMKMLAAGGIDIVTDYLRKPDVDNPAGYFEYEPVKNMADDAAFIQNMNEKAIKVVSYLLPYLPGNKKYKVIFMLRPIEEVLLSQEKMLKQRGEHFSVQAQTSLYKKFQNHLYDIRLWLARRSGFDSLFVKYPDVVNAPIIYSKRIAGFLNVQCDVEAMAAAVSPELYRNQITEENVDN